MAEFLDKFTTGLFLVLTSPVFWIVLAAALVLFLLLCWYRHAKLSALGQVEYSRAFSRDGEFVGKEFELTEVVRNNTLFPLFFVRMDFFIPSGLTVDGVRCSEYTKLTSLFHIPPHATLRRTHTVVADRRDHYHLYNTSIRYRKNDFQFTVPIDVYAYPNNYDADAELSQDLRQSGSRIASRKYIEDPFFLSAIRQYQPGDPMRSINFKASGRSFSGGMRQLMSNSYDSSRNFDSMIFLDLSTYGFTDAEELLERGLRCACFLFCEVLKNGGRVGFCANCAVGEDAYIFIPCATGETHTKTILQSFSEISLYTKRDFSMETLLTRFSKDLPAGTDIYLISSYIDDKTAIAVHELERRGRNVSTVTLKRGRVA